MASERDLDRADCLPAQQLGELQLRRLQHIVRLAHDNVEAVRTRLVAADCSPDRIQRLEDICRLPFTVKDDLRETYPYGLLAKPMVDVVRVHASSGTTGKPVVVAYTQGDMDVWTSAMVRTLKCYGLQAGDVLQNAFGYGLFTGGLGLHYGAERLGATVVPTSGGNTDRQIAVLQDFGITAICCTPSYFLHLLDRADELNVDLCSLPLRTGVFGAEPWTEAMRERIEQAAGIKAYDIYGLSEIVGPGVAAECQSQHGLHIFEDYFYPEIIDSETGQAVADGEEGELVLTTLAKEAMPILRYRTGDITALIPEPCACGRTLRRIQRISRRTDDMFIIRGVNMYPSQIEAALLSVKNTLPHYRIVLTREKSLDQVAVEVEVDLKESDDGEDACPLQGMLTDVIKRTVGIRVAVHLVPLRSLARSEGKAVRVIDNRES